MLWIISILFACPCGTASVNDGGGVSEELFVAQYFEVFMFYTELEKNGYDFQVQVDAGAFKAQGCQAACVEYT